MRRGDAAANAWNLMGNAVNASNGAENLGMVRVCIEKVRNRPYANLRDY